MTFHSDPLSEYAQNAAEGMVLHADPHMLIALLMEGALDKIAVAKTHMYYGNVAAKGEHIGWAISIIEGLRTSLNLEQGGDIAMNLNALYDYMERTLLEANLKNDPLKLEEVAALLRQIKVGWDRIPIALRREMTP